MINIVDNIKSTNTWLTEFGLDNYDSMISLKQSEGYGRLGRFWESDLGGLYFSVNLPNRNLLPIIIGISVADILVKLKLNVRLKWPNDILLNDMKLGGVICHSEGKITVAGLGINISNKPSISASTSLVGLGIEINKLSFVDELLEKIKNYLNFNDRDIIDKFLFYDCLIGKQVSWSEGNGTVATVSEDGRLVVTTNHEKKIYLTEEIHLND